MSEKYKNQKEESKRLGEIANRYQMGGKMVVSAFIIMILVSLFFPELHVFIKDHAGYAVGLVILYTALLLLSIGGFFWYSSRAMKAMIKETEDATVGIQKINSSLEEMNNDLKTRNASSRNS